MLSISALELKQKISAREDIMLIDVREPFEHEEFNIGGILIPLHSLLENIDLVEKDKPVIFYCQRAFEARSLYSGCIKDSAIPIYLTSAAVRMHGKRNLENSFFHPPVYS